MGTYTSSDFEKTISITTTSPLDMNSGIMQGFVAALNNFNQTAQLESVSSTATVSTFTTADSRSVQYTLDFGDNPPQSITFNVMSDSYWNSAEFSVIQALAAIITQLEMVYGLTALTVTYTDELKRTVSKVKGSSSVIPISFALGVCAAAFMCSIGLNYLQVFLGK